MLSLFHVLIKYWFVSYANHSNQFLFTFYMAFFFWKEGFFSVSMHTLVSHHMSIGVEYSVDPSNTSGGLYQSVTTSLEYVLVGTDLARAKPATTEFLMI